jgi:alpha-galactosidase/6-phospho-beta-glucosidase family protein
VPIIDALANGVGGFFQINVPNKGGVVEGIGEDVAVEVRAWIDRTGVQPLRMTPLPKKILLEVVLPKVMSMERGLEAYLTGDKTMLLYGILENHQTHSYDQAVAVLEDLLAMPGHEEAAAHYGGRKK